MFFGSKKTRTKAKLVRRNGAACLLASFDTSSPPLIWQFDLEKMATYIVKLQEKDGEWDLGIALPQGTFTPIAHFDERPDAEDAYTAVQKALIKGEPTLRRSVGMKWFWIVLLVLIGLYLFIPTGNVKHSAETTNMSATTESAPMNNEALAPTPKAMPRITKDIEPGVPMSADDVLPDAPQ